MGLFGKLFEKKVCAICGGEIGMLGNRKLEDGNCCKNCASKLSPWFDERRHSTVEAINAQLAYREANKDAVKNFHKTRTYGQSYQVLMLDEDALTFCVAPKNALEKENPDIVDVKLITSAEMKTREHKTEQKHKDNDGNMVSFNPPRYKYSYDFDYVIQVEHPYFDEMKFTLNSGSVELQGTTRGTQGSSSLFLNQTTFAATNPEYERFSNMGNEITNVLNRMRDLARYGKSADTADTVADSKEAAPVQNTAVQHAAAQNTAAQNTVTQKPAATWTCPYCDTVNTGAVCTGCGADK